MINRKFVAIVLAVGLIVSIGTALGQENIGYIGGLEQKEEMGLYAPSIGATGGYTLENVFKGDITGMISEARTFDRYKIAFSPFHTWIECYRGTNLAAYIEIASDKNFESGSFMPNGIYPLNSGGDCIVVNFPESKFDEILSILRNEDTLAIYYNKASGGIAIITTSTQQVGRSNA